LDHRRPADHPIYLGLDHAAYRRNTPVTTLISLHFTFGVIILAVAIVRLGWRATYGEPAPLDGIPPWQHLRAILHWLLYGLLFVVPVLGCSTPIGSACRSSCSGWNYQIAG